MIFEGLSVALSVELSLQQIGNQQKTKRTNKDQFILEFFYYICSAFKKREISN